MRKFFKIFFITLASLLLLLIIFISIALWYVFTPERITPIINKQAQNIFTCDFKIGKVEPTFFSTFPQFGLEVNKFVLINPVENAPNDTLLSVDRLIGSFDVMTFWRENELILSDIHLLNGTMNAHIDSLGVANFDIFVTDTTETPETEFPLDFIDLGNVKLENINFSYIDEPLKLNTSLRNLYAEIDGTIFKDSAKSHIKLNNSIISLEHAGEKYLNNAAVSMNLPVKVFKSWMLYNLNEAYLTVNDLKLFLDGSIEIDPSNWDIITDLIYRFEGWPAERALDQVPPSFQSYIDWFDVTGVVDSEGVIEGIIGSSSLPFMDMQISIKNGSYYQSGLPFPLSDINGNVNLYTDFITDELTYLKINRLNANALQSAFETKGMMNNLFSDVYFNLSTNLNLNLDEFNQIIDDSLLINMKGWVQGGIESDFFLSQAEKMELDNMKLSGSLTTSDLDFVFDSLWVRTDQSRIDFSLPNIDPSTQNTNFAYLALTSGILETGKIGDYQAFIQNADISIETSDLRDTTRIPDLICMFTIDTLSASMDTISIDLKNQYARASINPLIDKPEHPEIRLDYNSGGMKANLGNNSALINRFHLDADIINDRDQADVFQQWLVEGFIDLDQGFVNSSAFTYPVEIPSIRMDFDPEKLDIRESRMIIDKSDFELSGSLNNVLSYFREDSLLRGNFNFTSRNTDLLQLMELTSGMGIDDDRVAENRESLVSDQNIDKGENVEGKNNDTTFTGPYMVPEGIDFILSTNVKQATFGKDTAKDIRGDVSIRDGILLLDDLSFHTSAAKMQLTSMYRTPRRNHLYLGLDYKMLDIEIERLLEMIPDVDTLMPMLRSFRGQGEFHMAIESYLDSTYTIKKSTLRGASSIRGSNLVLLDGETFSEIARRLRFTRQAENRVDSLSAEFTIFREEIDIYPFLIVMDRYSAVVAGRHNFDLTFDYHITVVDSPLPVRLGIDLFGDMDNLEFSLARTRYPEFYRPARRGAVQSNQLELRRIIREALTERPDE